MRVHGFLFILVTKPRRKSTCDWLLWWEALFSLRFSGRGDRLLHLLGSIPRSTHVVYLPRRTQMSILVLRVWHFLLCFQHHQSHPLQHFVQTIPESLLGEFPSFSFPASWMFLKSSQPCTNVLSPQISWQHFCVCCRRCKTPNSSRKRGSTSRPSSLGSTPTPFIRVPQSVLTQVSSHYITTTVWMYVCSICNCVKILIHHVTF